MKGSPREKISRGTKEDNPDPARKGKDYGWDQWQDRTSHYTKEEKRFTCPCGKLRRGEAGKKGGVGQKPTERTAGKRMTQKAKMLGVPWLYMSKNGDAKKN